LLEVRSTTCDFPSVTVFLFFFSLSFHLMGFVGEKSDSSNLWDSLLVIGYWVSWGLLHCSISLG
jgi:hypothetical protein